MQAFQARFGKKAGRKAWLGFRSKNDPEAPTTVSKKFPYETESAFAKRGPGAARRARHRNRRSPRRARRVPERPGELRRPDRPRAARRRARLELGAGLRQALGRRPPDRGPRAAGRLLPAGRSSWRRTCTGPASTPAAPPSPGSTSRSSSATAPTTPGARRRRPPTTSTPSPRCSARTTSTTSTAASASRWKSWSRPRTGARTRSTRPKRANRP